MTQKDRTRRTYKEKHSELRAPQLHALEATCRDRLRQVETTVELGQVATIEALCAALAAQRKRSIYLEACPLPPTCSGIWIADQTTDYIFYAEDAAPAHQEQIILHELAHLLCGHRPLTDHREGIRDDWFPHVPPQAIQEMLARTQYDTDEEREAELLATLLEQRWRRARTQRPIPIEEGEWRSALQWLRAQTGDTE